MTTVEEWDAQVLNEAADLIDRHGWVQKDFGNVDDGFCAIGAVGKVLDGDPMYLSRHSDADSNRIMEHVKRVIAASGFNRFSVMNWNDYPGRTKDQVTTALREAAKNAQKGFDHVDW